MIFDENNTQRVIEIKNIGDGSADYIQLKLYVNFDDYDFRRDFGNSGWFYSEINDKSEFKKMLRYENPLGILPAKDTIPIRFWMQTLPLRKSDMHSPAILKIFYGEPVPKEIPFTFEIHIK